MRWVIAVATVLTACDREAMPIEIEGCDPTATCAAETGLVLSAAWPRHTIHHGLLGADGVNAADLNGDGWLDVVTGWEQSSRVTVSLNPGCTCAAREGWPTVVLPERIGSVEDAIFADVDQDGHLDVLAGGEGRQLFVYFGPDDPGLLMTPWAWSPMEVVAARDVQRWIQLAFADLDGDGVNEILAGGRVGAQVGVFRSTTPRDGTSWTWQPLGDVGCVYSLIPRDVDGDGDLDLVLSDHDPLMPRQPEMLGARWLENPGSLVSAWVSHPIRLVGGALGLTAFLDVRGDSIVVGSSSETANVTELVTTVDGLTWTETAIPQPDNVGRYNDVERGDIDGDGVEDFVFSYSHADGPLSGVVWLRAAEDGWQRGEISGPEGTKYDNLLLIDVDHDGDLDVVTSEQYSNTSTADQQLGLIWYANPAR